MNVKFHMKDLNHSSGEKSVKMQRAPYSGFNNSSVRERQITGTTSFHRSRRNTVLLLQRCSFKKLTSQSAAADADKPSVLQ